MAKPPTVIGVLTEHPAPTWLTANRHKIFGIGGLLIGYLIGTHLHGAPQQQQGPVTPAPVTSGAHRTPTAHIAA
ncbi:hypothetical protein [Streptomyces subrutilus]|uniref:Uncharacterized protein n=1 Tax=Streptomyces subrutilus TaxID=36818 RepID=A0A1E5P0I0_9ACTN|nr:hypothetical protein [Streptomyces subrutilus]OEJ22534.1 hypothetical protein BGK67_33995 [Streptomyces subrutilus]